MNDVAAEQITFGSGEVRRAAALYLPDDSRACGLLPAIVIGQSVQTVKDALRPHAHYLVRAGYAVLAIDYRSIGSSEGKPREQVFPGRYLEDFRNGASHLESRDDIDPQQIGVWGHSLGASVPIQAAAIDHRIACVAWQNPSMFNGWRAMKKARAASAPR